MRRVGIMMVGVAVLMMLALPSFAEHGEPTQQGNCPTDGKVESEVNGDLDDIVLGAGTHVCIKAGSGGAVFVTADGESTLRELSGLDKEISHYTIIETTTTTEPEETTTTEPEDTTTTEATTTTTEQTTTTAPEETTTTEQETTTTEEEATTTTVAAVTTTSVFTTTRPEQLPFTGIDTGLLVGVAMTLLASGGLLMRMASE